MDLAGDESGRGAARILVLGIGIGGAAGPAVGQSGKGGLVAHRVLPYGGDTVFTSGRKRMVQKLDDAARAALLARFPEWTHEPQRDAITRRFRFDDFA